MRPGRAMTSTQYFWDHHKTIEKQLNAVGRRINALVAGHKKDVVQSNRLTRKPRSIAIFGWHRLATQRPIQPLSTVHGANYADYSHGIRLVSRWGVMEIDGVKRTVYLPEILSDSRKWKLLSDEGRIASPSA